MRNYSAGDIFHGKYRIECPLGAGGFSVVYAADDLESGDQVALKLVRPDGDGYSPALLARFRREVDAVSRLTNPHTVRFLEWGEGDGGQLYVVFERVRGRDLSSILRDRGSLPADVVEHILRQLLASLGEAHREGVLHRDIKPENVRVFQADGDPWSVKLLDFGISRPLVNAPRLTATGELVGTPRYMSPEQLTERELTPASDFYSLGLMTIEMLRGREALHGGRWSDQLDRLTGDHRFDMGERAPARLQYVIMCMTARSPSDRPQTVAALLTLLNGAGPARQTQKTAVPQGRIVGALGIAALVIAGWYASRPDTPSPPAAVRRPGFVIRPAPEPDPVVEEAPQIPVAQLDEGCGKPPPFRGRGELRWEFDLKREPFTVYVPESYTESDKHPVLVLLHDQNDLPSMLLDHGAFERLADEHGFVIVAPNVGIYKTWKLDEHYGLPYTEFEEVAAQLCVDRARVFAFGNGAGGRAALQLSCQGWVNGVAINMYRRSIGYIKCGKARPVISFTALKSEAEPVEGGKGCGDSTIISVDDMEAYWRGRNNCAGDRSTGRTDHGSRCYRWSCTVPTEVCHISGGLKWFGAPPRMNLADCEGEAVDFPTEEEAWAFFAGLPPMSEEQLGEFYSPQEAK